MPTNRANYPDNWHEIRQRILARAGNHCEWCGVENGAGGYREADGTFRRYITTAESVYRQMAGIPVKKIKIVLTIAHIDHDTTNNADDNLAALCQRCHNRHDAPHRTVNAARTRERKRREAKVASGQQEMEL